MANSGCWPNKIIVKLKPGAISKPTLLNPVGILPSFLSLLAKLRRDHGLQYVQCLDRRGSLLWNSLTVLLINAIVNGDLKAALKELRAPLKDGAGLSFPKDPEVRYKSIQLPPLLTAKQLVAVLSRYVLTFEDGKMPDAIVSLLEAHSGVEYAENVPLLQFPGPGQTPGGAQTLPSTKVPSQEGPVPRSGEKLQPTNPNPTTQSVVEYQPMWGQTTMGWNADKLIGVDLRSIAMIDTGLDFYHKQLMDYISSGFTDYMWDRQGHGTHVAGIMVAEEATDVYTFGGLLRNPQSGTRLVSYKVVTNQLYDPKDGGQPFYPVDPVLYTSALSDIANTPAIEVINISMCRAVAMTKSEEEDINNLGTKKVVAAAGNWYQSKPSDMGDITYPAAHPKVTAVGALSLNDSGTGVKPWNNSRKGAVNGKGVDIWAPGFNILSTMPRYPSPAKKLDNTNLYVTDWGWMEGSSMAAPMITAVLAKKPNALDANGWKISGTVPTIWIP